jgi:molecular chaperone HscB
MSDPFDSLGLEPRYDLDLTQAEQRHRELSKTLHPDRFAGRPAAERRQALRRAIEVNEAWRALRDPIRRAEALLARLGVAIEEGKEPQPDPDLLMEMMEKREALASAGRRRDRDALESLAAELRDREARLVTALGARFRAVLAKEDGNKLEETEPILRGIGELRYYRRFLEEAAALEDEML